MNEFPFKHINCRSSALGWNCYLSKHMPKTCAIIYRGWDVHVNIYWFLSYHPEDTGQDSQKVEDEPSKLHLFFLEPLGFNKVLFDSVREYLQ